MIVIPVLIVIQNVVEDGVKNLECIHKYASTGASRDPSLHFVPFRMTRGEGMKNESSSADETYPSSSSSTSSSSFGYLISTFVKFKLAMALASTLPGRKLMRFFLMSDGV